MRLLRPHAETIPKWWTSSLLACLLIATPAGAGRKKKKPPPPEPEPVVVPAPPPKTPSTPLFEDALPFDPGAVPVGLANLTAQGCAGCHVTAHEGWAGSPHATAWTSEAFTRAVEAAGTPACTRCHLPLIPQSPELVTYDGGDLDKPVTGPNTTFHASLRLEGVTCAACHVRNGMVVATKPPEDLGKAPHPMIWSKDLTTSRGCASCHQLTWTGAETAFYDTYGEWEASPHAAAGIECMDCHGGAGAGSALFDHGMPAGTNRALSLLIDLPGLVVERGGPSVPIGITLQNTGAGHAFPTGSPFKGARLQVWMEGPPKARSKSNTRTEAFTADLQRTLTEGPPWDTTEDSRIPAGGEKRFDTELTLDHGAPEGAWTLEIRLVTTVQGQATDRLLLSRTLPLRVE